MEAVQKSSLIPPAESSEASLTSFGTASRGRPLTSFGRQYKGLGATASHRVIARYASAVGPLASLRTT
jgi:hypothetical protein